MNAIRDIERPAPARENRGAAHRDAAARPAPEHGAPIGTGDTDAARFDDLRFRALVGAEAWASLPVAVRRRFGKRLGEGRTVCYEGRIVACRMSRAGRVLAELLRVIGAPLPLDTDTGVPAAVVVTEDEVERGQFWTRIYGRHAGFPRVIGSSKRFRGPTGLEEYVGRGVGMALSASVEEGTLRFASDHYFLQAGRLRLRLPRWMTPGALLVSHVDRGAGEFEFVLELNHPYLGELVRQSAVFRDAPAR